MTRINPEEGTVFVAQALAMEDGKVFGVPAEYIKVAIEHFLNSVPHDTIVGLARAVQQWDLGKPDNYVGIVLARDKSKNDSIELKARFIWVLLFVGANQNRVRATFDALGIDPTAAFDTQTPPTTPGEEGAGEQSFSL